MPDRHPIALIAHGELAKRAAHGASCAYLNVPELADEVGQTPAQLLREIAEAVHDGRMRVTAVEIVPPNGEVSV